MSTGRMFSTTPMAACRASSILLLVPMEADLSTISATHRFSGVRAGASVAGMGVLERVRFHSLPLEVDVAVAGNYQQTSAAPDVSLYLLFPNRRKRFEIPVVDDHDLIVGQSGLENILADVHVEPRRAKSPQYVFIGLRRIFGDKQ